MLQFNVLNITTPIKCFRSMTTLATFSIEINDYDPIKIGHTEIQIPRQAFWILFIHGSLRDSCLIIVISVYIKGDLLMYSVCIGL